MNARALVAWNLRRIRVKRGVSQERLAYDCGGFRSFRERLAYDAGVDRSYVGGLERRAENPTIDLLDRLAKTLEVPLSELFAQPAKGATAPKPLPQGRKISRPKPKKP